MIGIYQIANIANGKIYVGSAINMPKRWGEHRVGLRRGNHKNKKLQAAFSKYGEGCFVFSEIELCEKGVLIAREQHWIDTLKSVAPLGYNLNPIAGSALGRKFPGRNLSPEHRKNIAASKIGKPRAKFSEEWRANLALAAQRKRPSQSAAIKLYWAGRRAPRLALKCKCGFTRDILASNRGKFGDPYQCRSCYLSSKRRD